MNHQETINRTLAYIASTKNLPYAPLALSYMIKESYDPYELAADFMEAEPGKPLPLLERSLVMDILEDLADQGNASALNDLGVFWLTGKGGRSDGMKARDYFSKAQFFGSAEASENLGWCALQDKDYKLAFICFIKGALLLQPYSTYYLAGMYEKGYYVQKDPQQAFAMYVNLFKSLNEDAAGFIGADLTMKLASMALDGIGCRADPLLALDYIEDAIALLEQYEPEADWKITKAAEIKKLARQALAQED